EHLFHLFLAFLHDAGKLDDVSISVDTALGAARATCAFVDRLVTGARGRPSEFNFIATNGRILVGVRRGQPMSQLEVRGIADCPVCRDLRGTEPDRRVSHEHLRAILLACSSAPVSEPGWTVIPEASIVTVTHSISVKTHSLAA